jgi:hypothetical protein
MATLVLLALFTLGLARTRRMVAAPRTASAPPGPMEAGLGRALLLATGLGLLGAGLTISAVGTTRVFVPQDLAYIGLSASELRAINPRLVPLIAHDRAGFGGALLTCGVTWLFCVWYGRPSRGLWQALLVAGIAGFSCAIGITGSSATWMSSTSRRRSWVRCSSRRPSRSPTGRCAEAGRPGSRGTA